MMKNRLLFFALLYSLLSFAQQTAHISLTWKDNTLFPYGEKGIAIPQFDGNYMSFNPDDRQLYFTASLPVGQPADAASLRITAISYEAVAKEQLGRLALNKIPLDINATISTARSRYDLFAVLRLSPIIKEGNGYKRITAFTYSFTTNANSAERNVANTNEVVNSVLATGNWYRFYIEKSGVYRLSKSFLQSLGMDTNVDPRKIRIYGNGGRMAPLLNSLPYPNDPEENAIRFVGEEDGSFDGADYILFYAEGVDNWNAESETNNNLYADKSYYYVTVQGSGNGKRIQQAVQPNGAAALQTGIFDEYQFYEKDLVNIAHVGRKWHGEAFNVENERDFDFTIPDIDTSSPVSVTVSAAANSTGGSSIAVTANAAAIGSLSFNGITDSHTGALDDVVIGNFTSAGSAITVKLVYNNGGIPSANAWLDYILLRAKRNLKGNNKQFRFRYNDAATNTGVLQYNFTNATSIPEVWDITDIYNAASIPNDGSQASFSFKAQMGEVRQYITVVPSDYYTPLREGSPRIANVNLKGSILKNSQGQFQDVDYIIVTPAFLNASAETLANLHRNLEGMRVKVVNLEDIYQEFSSGKQDIAGIRNFIKYVYNNASSDANRLKYINLFGDASFDYKNRIPNNTNIVPSFHKYVTGFSGGNYSDVTTFVSDDFYGLMGNNEGRMLSDAEKPDIATGRMLIDDKAQADEMVNKVDEYLNPQSYGRWRNEYITLADDLDGQGSDEFVPWMENLDSTIAQYRPFVNVRKFYIDAWVQEASAGGQRYPEAKEQFLRAINYGALVVNYVGHGSIRAMASERMFEVTDAQNLTNRYKYPLFITATCELTKFDDPYEPTTGEEIYWNPAGGAIAMVTTTRALFITAADSFNRNFTRRLYAFNQPAIYPTMAEALRLTKAEGNNASDYNVISFIGDPALKLAIPKPNIVLTEINDVPLAQSAEVLDALSFVRLGGRVTDENNNIITNYNGELEVTIFDKPINRVTLANDKPTVDSLKRPFTTLGEAIFRGNATVTNGQFEFGFVVPRDIRIPVGEGRVSFYAKRNNVLEDQTGYNSVIKIGGINTSAVADNTPPAVKLYMNDESFVSGGITNASPFLLALLQDEHGINTASGIGHDIIGILDGDETHPYLMNDYYQTAPDDYTHGTVRFPFINLEKGLHTLQFKAWDVYNNLVTAEIQFVVAGDDVIALDKVLNYPNPFVSYTEFWFTHNRPFEPLDVQVQVFTVSGKIVKTINQQITTDGFLSRDIKWDGRDDFGDKIGKGVYVYKLTVRSTITNKTAEKFEKLVLL